MAKAPENNSGMGNSAHSCLDRETTEGGVAVEWARGQGQMMLTDTGSVSDDYFDENTPICFHYLIIVGVFILFFL